jgi:hypothetical protein
MMIYLEWSRVIPSNVQEAGRFSLWEKRTSFLSTMLDALVVPLFGALLRAVILIPWILRTIRRWDPKAKR